MFLLLVVELQLLLVLALDGEYRAMGLRLLCIARARLWLSGGPGGMSSTSLGPPKKSEFLRCLGKTK
jgi:hypothetical protein